MSATYEVKIPGRFRAGVAYLDLETDKVPTVAGFRMRNGEALRRRWSVKMAGIARDGVARIFDAEGDESGLLVDMGEFLSGATEVVYLATREFDEMICKGRFTNARRAHEPRPFYPSVPGAESLAWRSLGRNAKAIAASRLPRDPTDAPSKGVTRWTWDRLAAHNLRDVVELILMAGLPDAECRAWCERVMADFPFALAAITG
jgi:hypothetical protein